MDFDFTTLSITELKDAKTEISAILKDRSDEAKAEAKAEKAEAKAEATEAGKAIAAIGKVVKTTYKGEDVEGLIVKISDKTVSLKIKDADGNEVINPKNGKPLSIWKYFYQIAE